MKIILLVVSTDFEPTFVYTKLTSILIPCNTNNQLLFEN